MPKIDISSLWNNTKKFTIKNSPKICTGIGIASSIAAVVMTIPATIKAIEVVRTKKEVNEELKKLDIFKSVWIYYLPPVLTELTGVIFLISSSALNDKRNAALAAAYSLSTTAFKEYKDKVIETIGEKKEASVRDSIIEDKMNSSNRNNEVIITDNETLFYDVLSDRYFKSTVDNVRKAVNKINHEMLSDMYVSLNELYYELGLNGIHNIGDELGWRVENGYIDIRFSGQITKDEKPCLALDFNIPPEYGYKQLY